MSDRYSLSEQLLERACRTIPLGSQTFSKSKLALPQGAAPYFAERASGCRLWDVDGHEYLDFVSGLLSISLGYGDPDVNQAVSNQLQQGVIFSLPHRLEMEVAERLVDLIPCAEQVRFGKNGTDATSAAVRLARAYTGRERIAVCGYHGWQDWYIGSTSRYLGVPGAVKQLTHAFPYNDLSALQRLFSDYPGQIAAVMMEPMTFDFPHDDYLSSVKALCDNQGAVLVFDEMITGFRFGLGGAQAYFGVTPHLATFGKGMANGFPLSAVVGVQPIMAMMERIFFSGTFGGETLSLAAAAATLKKLEQARVPEVLAALGGGLINQVKALIKAHELEALIDIKGHPAWTLLNIRSYQGVEAITLKTYFMQECLRRGILVQGSHNLNFAHSEDDIAQLIDVYQEVLPIMKRLTDAGELQNALVCEPLQPVFAVRSTD